MRIATPNRLEMPRTLTEPDMESTADSPIFSNDEEIDLELVENQPLRLSGLASFGFGLFSILAFTAPYMWVIPAFAIVLGLVAIRPAKGLYVGKTFASIGICLGLFFGGWAYVRHTKINSMRVERVTEFAIHWLDSFKYSHPEFSYEMTLPYGNRQYKTIGLEKFYTMQAEKDKEIAAEELQDTVTIERFKDDPFIQELYAAGEKPKWKLSSIVGEHKQYTLRIYTMIFEDTSGTMAPVELRMNATQMRDHLPSYWHVGHYEFAEI